MSAEASLRVRPMGPGEVLDDALLLVRQHFGTFLRVVAWTYFPWSLALHLALVPWQSQAVAGVKFTADEAVVFVAVVGLMVFLDEAVLRQLARGTLLTLNARACRGQMLSRRSAIRQAWRRLPSAAATTFLTGSLFGVGQIAALAAVFLPPEGAMICGMLILPAILLGTVLLLATWLAVPVAVLEGRSPLASALRGARLTAAGLGPVLLVAATLALIRFALSVTLVLTANLWLQTACGVAIDCLLMIPEAAAETVLYLAVCSKQEHLDLELLGREVELADAAELETAGSAGRFG